MPSTNVIVGLLEGRSSSRILKPPGGGHSDIFGRDTPSSQTPLPNKSSTQLSGIQACLYNSDSDNSANRRDTEANGTTVSVAEAAVSGCNREDANSKEQMVVGIASDETQEVEKAKLASVATTVPARPKVRVPPGGFSSGFW